MGAIIERATGIGIGDRLDAWVSAAREIDYDEVFAKVGLRVDRTSRKDAPAASLGARLRAEGGRTYVSSVLRGGAAQRAGVDPGDEIVAVAGHRVEGLSLDAGLRGRREGDAVDLLLARDGLMTQKRVVLDGARKERVKLVPREDATDAARAALAAWLSDPMPPLSVQRPSGSGQEDE
jgi:predicted metalloprotease with PDZ domain